MGRPGPAERPEPLDVLQTAKTSTGSVPRRTQYRRMIVRVLFLIIFVLRDAPSRSRGERTHEFLNMCRVRHTINVVNPAIGRKDGDGASCGRN